jgi:hypothetical protein
MQDIRLLEWVRFQIHWKIIHCYSPSHQQYWLHAYNILYGCAHAPRSRASKTIQILLQHQQLTSLATNKSQQN